MTKRRVIAAGLPAAGMTMFAAALALTGQPAHAATSAPSAGLYGLSAFAPQSTTDNGGLLTGNQLGLHLGVPGLAQSCDGGGTVSTCPDEPGAGSGGYGRGGGRGRGGYGTPTPTLTIPSPTGSAGTASPTPSGTGSGDGGYGGQSPTTPPATSSPTPTTPAPTTPVPTTPVPSTSVSPTTPCCGLSAGGPGGSGNDSGGLPSTGAPVVAFAALGGLLVGGGAALRYAGRHRRAD